MRQLIVSFCLIVTVTLFYNQSSAQHLSDSALLNLVEQQTFHYFWEGAEPVSGMARERFNVDGIYPENDKNIITSGGSGFGLMAIVVGINRGFISKDCSFSRKI